VNTWKVILATLVIYGTGVVTGAMVASLSAPAETPAPVRHAAVQPPAPEQQQQQQHEDFLRRMDRQLTLTPEQHEQIAKALKDSQRRTKVIRDKTNPEMREEVARVRREIVGFLTPEQATIFGEIPSKARGVKPPKGKGEGMPTKKRSTMPQTSSNQQAFGSQQITPSKQQTPSSSGATSDPAPSEPKDQ